MSTVQIILLIVFVFSTIVGYLIINRVPSLLHTPLMSGMNALSGVTVIGAIAATVFVLKNLEDGNMIVNTIFGSIAIILSMINVVGGFAVTHRMLRMFNKKKVKVNE